MPSRDFDRSPPSPRPTRRGSSGPRRLALSMGLLAAGAASAAEGAPEVLGLEAAVALALANNPAVRAAALAVESADIAVSSARTRYLPALSGQAHAGKLLAPVELEIEESSLGELPGTGPLPDHDATVRSGQDLTIGVASSVMQPVTGLYTARQGVRLARIGREVDQAELRAARAGLAAQVRRLYHQLVAGESTLAAARDQLATQRELARIAAQQVVQEAALRSDALQARSAVAATALEVRRIENGLTSGKEQLNRLLGRDVRTPFQVDAADAALPEPPGLEEARARALRDRPDLRQAHLLADKAETERRLKRWEHVPEVSVGVSYTSTYGVETLPRHVAIAGAFARWEFDWGRRSGEAARKSLELEAARARARDAEAAVLVEVGDRLRKLEEAREGLGAAATSLEALRARAVVVANRFRQEAALLEDALEAQAAVTRATRDHDDALRAVWSAQADLDEALGVAP